MITLTSVSKAYDMRYQRDDYSIKESLVTSFKRTKHQLSFRLGLTKKPYVDPFFPVEGFGPGGPIRRVLNDINLTIGEGETLALIGRNGCGKSTLLKLMAGIYQPDTGIVRVEGRISPLIELGAGFHPEFTGRENVYLNGQILGLSRQEIKRRFDEIVEFAEIADFINYPVRTYSSGMFMRLAFSVAVNADPDILLVDEIIAVGDAGFQAKCQGKMDEFKRRGKTIVLVTHSTHVVESWTHRAVYLRDGHVVCDDHPRRAVQQYLTELNIAAQASNNDSVTSPLRQRPLPQPGEGMVFGYNEQINEVDIDAFHYNAGEGSLVMNIDLRKFSDLKLGLVELKAKLLTQDRSLLIGESVSSLPEDRVRFGFGGLQAVADNQYVLELSVLASDGRDHTIARFGLKLDRGQARPGLIAFPTRLRPYGEISL